MDESKLNRQGCFGVCAVAGHDLCLWSAAFAHFVNGVLDTPLALLVKFLKQELSRVWKMPENKGGGHRPPPLFSVLFREQRKSYKAIIKRRRSWEMRLAPM